MQNNERGIGTSGAVGVVAAVVVLAVAVFLFVKTTDAAVKFDTPYQAVLLINNSVYFGKLDGYGTKHPVLSDVYYVQSVTNPDNKQVSNVLIKRGKEPPFSLYAPDRMYLNPSQIVLVETVATNSKVADLIAQSKAKGQ